MSKKTILFILLISITSTSCYFINNLFALKKNQECLDKTIAIVISGPSGVGKSTIIKEFMILQKEDFIESVSATTRNKRENEIDNVNYIFLDKNEFLKMQNNDEFLEYTKNFDNYYGTPKKNYFNAAKLKKDIIFDINYSGLKKIQSIKDINIVSIFIAPPSTKELITRLKNRQTENESQLKKRIDDANESMSVMNKYDYTIHNYNVKSSVKLLNTIVTFEKHKMNLCSAKP